MYEYKILLVYVDTYNRSAMWINFVYSWFSRYISDFITYDMLVQITSTFPMSFSSKLEKLP